MKIEICQNAQSQQLPASEDAQMVDAPARAAVSTNEMVELKQILSLGNADLIAPPPLHSPSWFHKWDQRPHRPRSSKCLTTSVSNQDAPLAPGRLLWRGIPVYPASPPQSRGT